MSDRGKSYAHALASYIQEQDIQGLRVWTSWLKRTIQTVADVTAPQERWKALNEIDAVSIGNTKSDWNHSFWSFKWENESSHINPNSDLLFDKLMTPSLSKVLDLGRPYQWTLHFLK